MRKTELKELYKMMFPDYPDIVTVAQLQQKKMSQDGLLTADAVYAVLAEEKPNQKEQIKLPRDELRKYFPQNYSDEQIKRDILKGLELLKRQRERNRDAR